jgi:hypothetical protein
MPKNPGTGHSVYLPIGDRRFPSPWSVDEAACLAALYRLAKGPGEMGLSSTTDKQKEAVWRVEFEALGEQSVLKNAKQGATYKEAKRQAAFCWLSEQAQLRDRRQARTAELAWLAIFVSIAVALIGIIGLLVAVD